VSVYFAQRRSGGLIKIGWSTGVHSRMIALRTRLLGSMPGRRKEELAVHERFKHLRAKGEWFRPDAELLEFIRTKAQQHEPENDGTQSPIRMSESLKERIREYRQQVKDNRGFEISYSEAIRSLIERGLKAVS